MAYANMDSTMSRPSSGIASPPRQSHIRSRTQSISSDRPSTVGHGLMSPPLTVSPEAAFIASSAASQIVTNDHDSHADTWYDQHGIEPSGETVLVSPAALQLVNNFLDQLLFNFLQLSRSTALSSLRPAVSEVLKPKLAKDAINNADEELREYLGGNDDDGLVSSSAVSEDWDVELVWKRARLRCMVYSSLGDMEEEDEDYYMEQEHLGGAEDWLDEVVSPAVAIFLTSILEYMGEQALIVAGQAAYHRMRARYEKELKDGSRSPGDVADRIVVEELDMERVALDRTLGRLWRAWKKRIRSPGVDQAVAGRAFSKDSSSRPTAGGRTRVTAENLKRHNMARDSTGLDEQLETPMETPAEVEQPAPGAEGVAEEVEEEEPAEEYLRAARIPLPMTDRDVDEIEVPGLVYYSEDEEEEEDDLLLSPRPKSLIIWGSISMLEATSPVWQMRQRSSSVPAPARRPYRSPPSEAEFSDGATPTQEEVTTPTSAGDYVEVPATKPKYRAAKGPIANIITSATSRGFSNASTPRSDGEFDEDDDDEIPEDFEILTTSRVSIGGQSPTVSESGMAQGGPLPVRSNSVRSARLIEVGPKSPVLKTRHESPEPGAATSRRTASGTSASKKSIAEEQPISHKDVTSAPRQTRKKTAESIPEMPKKQEYVGQPVTVLSPVTSEPGSVSSPRRFEDLQNQIQSVQPIFGSVGRHKEGPSSGNLGPPGTRVTIISTSTSPGPFVEETPPQVPEKSPVHARHQQQRVPTPPERVTSGSRQVNGAPGSPTTIGIPSVEGAAARGERMSGGSGRSNNDYAVRPIHTSGSAGSSSSTNKFKPIRTSEDGKNGVARTFEELIQSDQTMKYTLTPESMRDIEVSRSKYNRNRMTFGLIFFVADTHGLSCSLRLSIMAAQF